MAKATDDLKDYVKDGKKSINLWDQNAIYSKGDLVLYFKKEVGNQTSVEQGLREFAFILICIEKDNTSIPTYELVDGLPDFHNTGWKLINPTSYLLQDLNGMRKVVKDVMEYLLEQHVKEKHGLMGASDIETNLVKKDYSNLVTSWKLGKFSLTTSQQDSGKFTKRITSNGLMEYDVEYSFDSKANKYITISDKRYYYQKSPIWDESDATIFSQKYIEDNMFSTTVHPIESNGETDWA